MKTKILLLLLLAIPISQTYALAKDNTIIICTESPPDGFDIVRYNNLPTANASSDLLFEGLLQLDEKGDIKPCLAKTWTSLENGKKYIFHLRENVSFHKNFGFIPTRYFNADDVVNTINRLIDPKHPWHKSTGEAAYPTAESLQLASIIKSVSSSIDKKHVTFVLNKPNSTFLAMLSMGFLSIYSEEYMKFLSQRQEQRNINSKPIGTGPFMLKTYRKPNEIRYQSHPNYWNTKPKINKLIYAVTANASTRLQKIKNGECQIAISPPLHEIHALKQQNSIVIDKNTSFMTAFVAFNTKHKALQDIRVRQAINYAVNKKKFIEIAYNGLAEPAVLPIPSNNWAFPQKFQSYTTDLDQAKKLMRSAGYEKGLQLTLLTRSSNSTIIPNSKISAELLQADLMKIGIQLDIKILDWAELRHKAFTGEFDLLLMGWAGDNGDPDNFLTPLFSCNSIQSGNNFSQYCDITLDKVLQEAKNTHTILKRKQAYYQALHIIHHQALWLPLAHPHVHTLLSKDIQGFTTNPYGRLNLNHISLK